MQTTNNATALHAAAPINRPATGRSTHPADNRRADASVVVPAAAAADAKDAVPSRAWALINNTRRQHVDIGTRGESFERDPIRYMRTVLSLGWSADDDMVMLPTRHMDPAYAEVLVWPVASDDAASSSTSAGSSDDDRSDWSDDGDSDDDCAYSSDYDHSDTGSGDDDSDGADPVAEPRHHHDGAVGKNAAVTNSDPTGAGKDAAHANKNPAAPSLRRR